MIIIWILLELNLVVFIIFILSYSKDKTNTIIESSFFYLIVQGIGSSLFLLRVRYKDYFNFITYLNLDFILFSSLLVKLGFFPFQIWIFVISKIIEEHFIIFLLTLQKVPRFTVLVSINFDYTINILAINIAIGRIMLLNTNNLKNLLVSSSLYTSIWIILFFFRSPFLFLGFVFSYFLNNFYILKNENSLYLKIYSPIEFIIGIVSILFVLGLPPLGLFFIKFFSINILILSITSFFFIFVWFFTFIRTFGYFFYFIKIFLRMRSLFKSSFRFSSEFKITLLIFLYTFFLFLLF